MIVSVVFLSALFFFLVQEITFTVIVYELCNLCSLQGDFLCHYSISHFHLPCCGLCYLMISSAFDRSLVTIVLYMAIRLAAKAVYLVGGSNLSIVFNSFLIYIYLLLSFGSNSVANSGNSCLISYLLTHIVYCFNSVV